MGLGWADRQICRIVRRVRMEGNGGFYVRGSGSARGGEWRWAGAFFAAARRLIVPSAWLPRSGAAKSSARTDTQSTSGAAFRLPFGILEAFSGAFLAVFFPFFDAGIAGEETRFFELCPQRRRDLFERF